MTAKSRTSNFTGKATSEVKATSDKPGKVQSTGLFGAEPKPWPKPVDGGELLDALVVSFRRYLALPEGAAETLALWVVFTYAIDVSAVAPRLAILSPIPRCGKTTLLGLLIRLVRRPLPTSNITPAVVYRVIAQHQPTPLIDEADTFFDGRSELVGILNSGHSRDTAFTMRCEGDSHEVTRFGTYAAIAIAKIGKLPPALLDRSLVIRMQRKRPGDEIERFREDRAATELSDLKRKVLRWASDNISTLKAADPDIPKALNDRAADNWRILFAVADPADGYWPDTARRVAVLISGEEEDSSLAVQLLHDIKEIFDTWAVDRMASAGLLAFLVSLDHRPWATLNDGEAIRAHRLSAMLEPFGIRSKVVRIGDRTPHGYERAQFEDAWARYPRPQSATPQHERNINGLDDTRTATQSATDTAASATRPASVADQRPDVADDVALLKAENYNDFNDVADVALSDGKTPAQPQGRSVDLDSLFAASLPGLQRWQEQERRRKASKGKPRPQRL